MCQPPTTACLTQDIEGANALLDENGVVDSDGDGIREYNGMPLMVSYQTSTNSVRQKTQALIRQWWSEIGIETELINHDASVFFGSDPNSPDTYQKFYTDLQMYTTGPSASTRSSISPTGFAVRFQRLTTLGAAATSSAAATQEYDALFDQLTQTPVGPERHEPW